MSRDYDYMLLSRLIMDLEYYFGYGKQCANQLFFKDIKEHIQGVEDQYNSLDPKPEWFTENDLKEWQDKVANSLL